MNIRVLLRYTKCMCEKSSLHTQEDINVALCDIKLFTTRGLMVPCSYCNKRIVTWMSLKLQVANLREYGP